jgi:disulfide oxidoreductase YuzD
LRSLHKSYPNELYAIFNGFGFEILDLLNSTKSTILKNILAFIYEILSQGIKVHIEIISKVLPLLIKLCIHTSKSIRICAKSCVSLLYGRNPDPRCVSLFAAASMDTSRKELLKRSFKFFMYLIYSLKEQINLVDNQGMTMVFQAISFNLTTSKCVNLNSAKKLVKFLHGLIGREYMLSFLKSLIDDKCLTLIQADQIMDIAVNDNIQTKSRMSYQIFKQRNSEILQNNIHNNTRTGIVSQIQVKGNVIHF